MKRHVVAVTGIRSEYDIMSSVFAAVAAHPRLRLSVIATGAHLSPSYGNTVQAIRADGFEVVEEIESLLDGDRESSRVKGLAIQLQGLTQALQRLRPDML